MTEEEARQVLLLQALETAPTPPGQRPVWGADDSAWATRQALAAVGEGAAPAAFVKARAEMALQRLLPRDAALQRWLARRGWHPAWVLLALVLGAAAGLLADQLGAPQRVNLLAPAVWAVVAWNLAVYLVLLLPLPHWPGGGLRAALAQLGLRVPGGDGATARAGALWAEHAAPLMRHRAALVLHSGAAALAAGLVAGLYLRGLVLDYRAGWQSTFLDATAVQQALGWLLAPASALTGIAVPEVAPLQLAPGADAAASAAPWIHLYAATLGLAVVLPRTLLALWAARRASAQARRFPLKLDTPYFEALHPLMRPGRPHVLRLLWVAAPADLPAPALFGVPWAPAPAAGEPFTVLRGELGDELQLLCAPPGLEAAAEAPAAGGTPWWATVAQVFGFAGGRAAADPLPALREQVAAVLLHTRAGAQRPAWLARLGRPVVVLLEDSAEPDATAPTTLPARQRADGWLPEGRLLQALAAALDDDLRLQRLTASWQAAQAARFDALVAELADTLAEVATTHEALADEGSLLSRGGEAEAARTRLEQRLDTSLQGHLQRLQVLLWGAAESAVLAGGEGAALRSATGEGTALRARVGEGRAALVGGALSGALVGLKADLLSGGLTLGAGAVAGGLLGALGAAGAARGLNLVRGTDRSFVAWDEAALTRFTETLLQRALGAAHGLAPEEAAQRLAPALAARQGQLATLWRARRKTCANPGEAAALALSLQAPLADTLVQALGGPGRHA
ncbi:DUF2868 domain-containing protein [Rubrivivax rivuli]|uniref:DUF2868 domain-containing protein n=1 Tax=Rubrivivax rivuli TaxID=1862385 RepID=A0A437R937_9BURK|nr:DUF2868 domain-containing protein [Rubrivivax rivuli]RVU43289.1 DUF2868 domain-containing protein [Rubrivivax rivuli]